MHEWEFSENILRTVIDGRELTIHPIPRFGSSILYAPASLAPSRFCLFEWQEYVVRGADQVKGHLNVVHLDADLFRFQFENQIGRATLRFEVGNETVALPVEVLSKKYPSPEAHLAFLSALLEDLAHETTHLPFTISAPTNIHVEETQTDANALFVYHFVRQFKDELISAIELVVTAPHRRLTTEARWRRIDEAKTVSAQMLSSIITHPQHLTRADSSVALALHLGGLAPQRVFQELAIDTFDSIENRFVRAALQVILRAIQDLPLEPWWRQTPSEAKQEIGDLTTFLAETLRHAMFDDVGEMSVFPGGSQVLLRRDGYRELLDLWRRFHLAQHPFFADLQQAIDLRDIATLYEYWCFFELARQMRLHFEAKPHIDLDYDILDGVTYETTFRWQGLANLRYNVSFARAAKQSYSLTLRPDFILEQFDDAGTRRRIVYDAKFRFSTQDLSYLEEDDNPPRDVKAADLHKMHTYRDALNVDAAIVVYPGDRSILYRTNFQRHEFPVTLLDTLDFQGVGAVCMEPKENTPTNA